MLLILRRILHLDYKVEMKPEWFALISERRAAEGRFSARKVDLTVASAVARTERRRFPKASLGN